MFTFIGTFLLITVTETGEQAGAGRLVGWLLGRLVGWLLGMLVGWLLGMLVGWLLGMLVGWLASTLNGLLRRKDRRACKSICSFIILFAVSLE